MSTLRPRFTSSPTLFRHTVLTQDNLHIVRYTRQHGSSAYVPRSGRARLRDPCAGERGLHNHGAGRAGVVLGARPDRVVSEGRMGAPAQERHLRSLSQRHPHGGGTGAGEPERAAARRRDQRRSVPAGRGRRMDRRRPRPGVNAHPAGVRPRHRARDGAQEGFHPAPADHGRRWLAAEAPDRLCGRADRARHRRPLERPVRRRQLGDVAEHDAEARQPGRTGIPAGPSAQLLAVLRGHADERGARATRIHAAEEGRARLRAEVVGRALHLGRQLRPATGPVRASRRRRLRLLGLRMVGDEALLHGAGEDLGRHREDPVAHHVRHGRAPPGRQAHPLQEPEAWRHPVLEQQRTARRAHRSSAVDHTGIYLGKGWTINSHGSGAGVTINYIGPGAGWYHDNFVFGWRIMPRGV